MKLLDANGRELNRKHKSAVAAALAGILLGAAALGYVIRPLAEDRLGVERKQATLVVKVERNEQEIGILTQGITAHLNDPHIHHAAVLRFEDRLRAVEQNQKQMREDLRRILDLLERR